MNQQQQRAWFFSPFLRAWIAASLAQFRHDNTEQSAQENGMNRKNQVAAHVVNAYKVGDGRTTAAAANKVFGGKP